MWRRQDLVAELRSSGCDDAHSVGSCAQTIPSSFASDDNLWLHWFPICTSVYGCSHLVSGKKSREPPLSARVSASMDFSCSFARWGRELLNSELCNAECHHLLWVDVFLVGLQEYVVTMTKFHQLNVMFLKSATAPCEWIFSFLQF